MKLFLNRLQILSKRSFINPAMYIMVGVIVLMALLVIFVPEKQTSVYIPVALLNEDSSEETGSIVDELCTRNSIFHFYEVDDEEELYKDLASGKANTAYIFPEDFITHLTSDGSRYDVRQVVTPASSFMFLSREEVFGRFYEYSARQIISDTFSNYGYEVDIHDPEIERLFSKYLKDESLFALEGVVPRQRRLLAAALLGALAFLNDQDNRIYLRFGLFERIYLGLIQVAVFTFPAMIISVLCFAISKTEFSLLHVTGYTLLVTLIAFILGTFMTILPIRTARSKIFSAVLPVYLILSFLFSGILMDLTNFGTELRTLARLFPPSMF